jgi:hypothetical protein
MSLEPTSEKDDKNINCLSIIDTLNSVRKELNRIADAIEEKNKIEKELININIKNLDETDEIKNILLETVNS